MNTHSGNRLWFVFMLLFLSLTLSACSQSNTSRNQGNTRASAPVVTPVEASETQQPLETLKVLSAPKGLNTKRLFAQPLNDPNQRFGRLEQETQKLRDDFDLVSPAITRLVAVEQDMRDLMAQLETLVQAENQPAPAAIPIRTQPVAQPQQQTQQNLVQPTPTPQQVLAANPPAQQVQSVNIDSSVTDVRLGEHLDKTRIVIDIDARTRYTARLIDGGTRLQVVLPTSDWETKKSWRSNIAPLVTSYRVSSLVEGGHKVVFDLSGVSQIKTNEIFPPRSNRGHRIVIDLFNADLHQN